MIDSSIMVINVIPKISSGINGGILVKRRNETLLKNIFSDVKVYNHYYQNDSKIRIFFHSLFGINCNLTKRKISKILDYVESENCSYIFISITTIGKLAKYAHLRNIKVISFFENVEYVYFIDHIKNSSNLIKFSSFFKKRNIFSYERIAAVYSDKILSLNERDSSQIFNLYGRKTNFCIPITFDDKFDETKALKNDFLTEKRQILFVGSDFFGNTEGLFWFIENCLTDIDATLIVVGSGMDKYCNKYKNDKVVFKGFVDDLALEYYSADLVVLPILSGSGMKTKTCESFMYGKTVVGSVEAFEGYDKSLFDNCCGYLCTTSQEYINTINKLLGEETSKINNNSRKLYKKYYDTKIYGRLLEEQIIK